MKFSIIAWLILLVPSFIVGLICAYFIKGKLGVILAGAIPWFGLLACIIYSEYFVPHTYKGGGASMWPIAQLFGGTIAAATSIAAYNLSKDQLLKKSNVK